MSSRPLDILYAMPGYKPAWHVGGPIQSVAAAAEALVARGHRVTVFTTNGNLDEDIDVPLDQPVDVDGVTVWYFRREEPIRKYLSFVPYLSRSMGYLYAPAMAARLEEMMPRFDAVDTQMPFVYPTYACARAAIRHRVPLFYHQRGILLDTHMARRAAKKKAFINLFERPVMQRATGLIALSEAERAAFLRFAPATPAHVVPNGVTLPADAPGHADRVAERWGIPADVPVILFLGRLHPWKGPDILLEAFQRVRARHPGAVVVMAGVDEAQVAQRWGGTDNVVVAGVVTGETKADLLRRADIFCLPSEGEGLSMAILEALSHRTAIIVSPECNFAPGDAGLIRPRTVEGFADGLAELLGDPDRTRRMGEAGRALVEQFYTWDAVTDRLVEIYSREAC